MAYCRDSKFYAYNYQPYALTFPLSWAKTHLPTTGPIECLNCQYYGSWNGVFVCYCANCANLYNGERGPGVTDYLYKGEDTDVGNPKAAMNSYMSGLRLCNIGDKGIHDSAVEFFESNFDKNTMSSCFNYNQFYRKNNSEWIEEFCDDDDDDNDSINDSIDSNEVEIFIDRSRQLQRY
jgi:hypothetical protein